MRTRPPSPELRMRAGRHTVVVGNAGKEIFGAGGVTKGELAGYYRAVAPAMLPHIRGRPLAVQRFPHGITDPGGGLYVKNRPVHAPQWVDSVRVPRRHEGPPTDMIVCDDSATLVWLADQAAITLHPWLSRAGHLDRPDRLIIDLDPAEDDFRAVCRTAHDVREVLDGLGLATFVMTTGSRGLHVVSPIRPEIEADDARRFARIVAELTVRRRPEDLTTQLRKDRRHGRIFIDYLRNGHAQLAVAPYSVRPLPDAPVAVPVAWEELDGIMSARQWTVRNLGDRAGHDPWAGMARHARSPLRAIGRLG